MKKINELNLQATCDGLSSVLSQELGGNFSVTIRKFEVPNKSPAEDMILTFVVRDNSMGRDRKYLNDPKPSPPDTQEKQ